MRSCNSVPPTRILSTPNSYLLVVIERFLIVNIILPRLIVNFTHIDTENRKLNLLHI